MDLEFMREFDKRMAVSIDISLAMAAQANPDAFVAKSLINGAIYAAVKRSINRAKMEKEGDGNQ
jgi:hypothetical protein